MLYRQMPREAFESERDKEQMLIDRGEQYKRAIYLYYVQNNRQWPTKIEDLESTNNHRYLRHRYVDPYTGKDEWRLVHTNGTFLTDSLVTPPPAQGPNGTPGSGTPGTAVAGAPGSTGPTGTGTSGGTLTSSLFTQTPAIGSTAPDPNAPPEVNAQVQRRPSDRNLVQNSNFQNQPGGATANGNDPGYQPFNPNAPISLYPANPTGGQNAYNPSALPPISLYPNGYNAPAAAGGERAERCQSAQRYRAARHTGRESTRHPWVHGTGNQRPGHDPRRQSDDVQSLQSAGSHTAGHHPRSDPGRYSGDESTHYGTFSVSRATVSAAAECRAGSESIQRTGQCTRQRHHERSRERAGLRRRAYGAPGVPGRRGRSPRIKPSI